MDIFLKYELFYDENDEVAFNEDLLERQLDTLINIFSNDKLDIRVYQLDSEKRFFDRNDNYSPAVALIVKDLKEKDSLLSKLFKDKFVEEDQSELDRNILIFKYLFPLLVKRQYRVLKEKCNEYYIEYYKNCGFDFVLPQSLVKEKYGDQDKMIDLSLLTPDEFIEYLIPEYYLSLGYWDNDKLRKKDDVMKKLSKSWYNKKNQIVSIIE